MGEEKGHLSGKVAWVTGSSRGIGRVIATHLADMGAAVALHGTTATATQAFGEGNSLEEVASHIAAQSGAHILPVHGDLTDEGVVSDLVESIRDELGPIDILVNCAGGDIGAAGTGAPMAGKPPQKRWGPREKLGGRPPRPPPACRLFLIYFFYFFFYVFYFFLLFL